jgi:hypothetical protein
VRTHLYFSLIPEALIASQLDPAEFGQYYATGYGYKSKGQALFFEVDPDFRHPFLEIDEALAKCRIHDDGTPKNSVYVATYRVLEHIPVSALGSLHVTTAYGATLELTRSAALPAVEPGLHLYKELAPVSSLVASSEDPRAFYESITVAPTKFVRFPGLFFVELELGPLALDPDAPAGRDLPYDNLHHLREALAEVTRPGKVSKLVERVQSPEFAYRMVKVGSGFYYGNGADLACYPMPPHEELRERHPLWWRSANK